MSTANQKQQESISHKSFMDEENDGRAHSAIFATQTPQTVTHKLSMRLIRVGIIDARKESMAYKETAVGHKTLSYSGLGFPLEGLMTKLKSIIKSGIPIGYQDESGFHMGVKPDKRNAKWPVTW